MRENMGLHRGKRKDNGEWVYGSLLKVKIDGEACYLIFGEDFLSIGNEVISLLHALVDPETIGEYSGFTDKNDKKVFEGDVVRYMETDYHSTMISTEVVKYYQACFLPRPLSHDCDDDYYSYSYHDFEVIGNIYDNPELLEVSGDE